MFYDEGDVTVCEWRKCDQCDDGFVDRDFGYRCDWCAGNGGYWRPIHKEHMYRKK